MFLRKYIITRTYLYQKQSIGYAQRRIVGKQIQQLCNYSDSKALTKYNFNIPQKQKHRSLQVYFLTFRRFCSKETIDVSENDLNKINDIFPLPRVILNEFNTKTSEAAFDIHYKQNVITPKGVRKKVIQNDWTCTYAFVWPEKKKFECTAISKRKAAEKAATEAIHWLYTNKRIDSKGSPLYDVKKINDIRDSINETIVASVTDNSVERVERIWEQYENDIKPVYEKTLARIDEQDLQMPGILKKDSTIDEEDEFSDEDSSFTSIDPDNSEVKQKVHPVYGRIITPPSQEQLHRRDKELRRKFQLYEEQLTPLPIDEYFDKITSTIEENRVSVIVGAAGCGKSTRAPIAVLRQRGSTGAVIVAEPRRVAAIGLAERVASELGEKPGEAIGYQVRLHSKLPRPPAGSILYCTSGVLLRRLQLNPGLEGCTHVVIDEAHERDVNTDVTLLLLKRALQVNTDLKVVVMSATLDTTVFTKYFNDCPVIEVPGRTYPVATYHLDDVMKNFNIKLPNTLENCNKDEGKPYINCHEVAEVIKSIDKREADGAILVFLPGWAEIKYTKQLLDQSFRDSSMHMILPVHSRLSTTDQTKMFSQPTRGVRKIVLATNIAETSITIPDVVYVVDTGAHKENTTKEGAGTASLETVWVSMAGAKQRTGRAGRVQPGKCYRLYTKEKEAEFTPHTTPEILRIPLEQTVLDCKTYAPDDKVENFLSQLPEPPSKKSIQYAVNDLVDLGALTSGEQVTRVGSLLSSLSLHPRLGRTLLHSAVVGNVLSAANVVSHCSANVEVFAAAADRRDEIREIKKKYNATSDHSALHCLQHEYEQCEREGRHVVEQWCDRAGLKRDRLRFVKSLSNLHLEQLLKSSMIEEAPDVEMLTRFSDIDELTTATLLSGANSLLVTKKKVKTKGKLKTSVELFTSAGDRAHVGTESVNYGIKKHTNKPTLVAYFGGYHSTERRALVVYKTSLITPQMALLFCKGDIKKQIISSNSGDMTILSLPRHKLKVHLPTSQAEVLLKAKEMLWTTIEYYIHRDVKTIDYEQHAQLTRFRVKLIKALARILVEAHREYVLGKSALVQPEDLSE